MSVTARKFSYDDAAEELFKRLDATRSQWKTSYPQSAGSENDSFARANPKFRTFVRKLEKEIRYELSDMQCSWAIIAFARMSFADWKKSVDAAATMKFVILDEIIKQGGGTGVSANDFEKLSDNILNALLHPSTNWVFESLSKKLVVKKND